MITIAKASHHTAFALSKWFQIQIRALSAQAQPQSIPQDTEEWKNARPFSEIPGPSKLQTVRAFLPGGKFHGMLVQEFSALLRKDYGNLAIIPGMLGKPPVLLSFDPNHYEKIVRSEGIWPIRPGHEILAYYRGKMRPELFKGMGGLLSDHGEKWFKLRSTVNPVMLRPKAVKSYIDPVDEVARDFLQKIELIRDVNNEMPDDFLNELNLWAFETIGVIALDHRLGAIADSSQNPEAFKLIQAIKDYMELSFKFEIQPSVWRYYKSAKFVKLIASMDATTKIVMKYINNALEKMKKMPEENGSHNHEQSVLQKLLTINRDCAVLMAFDMLLAGIDTTSATTANLLYKLATNPDKQELLRKEIFKILPNVDSKITIESLNHLPYFTACLKESQRLLPILPAHFRSSGKDIVLNGYQIPRNTHIAMINTILQIEDEHFPESSKFLPERWLRDETGGNVVSSKHAHPFLFLPFGFGPRSCIGKRFAEMEMQIFVSRLLRDYKIEWNYGKMEFTPGIVISPSNKLKFKLTKI